jgi:hypothetical protein
VEAFSPDEHGTETCVYDEDGSQAGKMEAFAKANGYDAAGQAEALGGPEISLI